MITRSSLTTGSTSHVPSGDAMHEPPFAIMRGPPPMIASRLGTSAGMSSVVMTELTDITYERDSRATNLVMSRVL